VGGKNAPVAAAPAAVTNPEGDATGSRRVLRLGSWVEDVRSLRSESSSHLAAGDRASLIGFRVARSIH
jgi:formylglycine-generating enzyme required for sulfatase activity